MGIEKKRIVIVGATSAIAERCARLWVAESPCEVILVGRDLEKLELVGADLRVRGGGAAVIVRKADFMDPHAIAELAEGIFRDGPVDIVLIAHGMLPNQAECQDDLSRCNAALQLNGISPVLLAEAFVAGMQRAGRGHLAIVGSVAGDRGRRSNYVYGAAKGLVSRYAQGLQHRFAGSEIRVTLIKPGPTDTPMTAHLKAQGARLASADEVARGIVDGIKAGKRCVYVPARWRGIMMIIRHLPDFIFDKLNI